MNGTSIPAPRPREHRKSRPHLDIVAGTTIPAYNTDTPATPAQAQQGLPATLTVEQAAHLLGCGRTLAYNLARRDALPCTVLRLGRRYMIPTADLLRALGLTPHTGTSTEIDAPGDVETPGDVEAA